MIRRRSRWGAAAVAAATAVTVAGTAAAPAQSAPDNQCPEAFPVSELLRDDPVTGLTVSQGTTPEGFEGSVIGVLNDGIMPGLDMVLVRLSSPEVDRVGIWQGMSGSPVYAADGRLIGAVAYGLAGGPSPAAGVTPAADMQALLSESPEPALDEAATEVDIPKRIGKELVADRVATAAEVDSGLSQLRLPFVMAGVSPTRFAQVAKKLDVDGVRMIRAGSAVGSAEVDEIVPGGNIAAAVSYGDISYAGVGTATMVCGGEAVGFGHPMLWTGPTGMSMHGADALYVQEDTAFPGFKVANLGGPVGTISTDGMAGIAGAIGVVPDTGDITSTVTMGGRSRTGTTHVNLSDWVPDIGFSHLLANEDRIFDGLGKGMATMSWQVEGTREDGSSFTLDRDDVYADEYDITFGSAWGLGEDLYALEGNGVEDITIDTVDVQAELSRGYDHYVVKKAWVRKHGDWVRLRRDGVVRLPAGRDRLFKVTMTSNTHGSRTVVTDLRIPRAGLGRVGILDVLGGNNFYSDDYYEDISFEEEFFGGGQGEPTFDEVLADMAAQPSNDDLVLDLNFYNRRGRVLVHRQRQHSTGLVVDGGFSVAIRATR
jgi:hypothetical protein